MTTKMHSRRKLNILILHDNDDLSQLRRTSFNHSFCLLKYAPWNSYTLQSFRQPVSRRARQERFDAIILDTTFLCWRWSNPRTEYFDVLLRDYAFVADSDAVKIALPQDEYDHASLLDDWLTDWRVDLIYSVCYEHRDLLYPRAATRAEIVEGMTGYIDDSDVAMMRRLARPFEQREIDVGYRAKSLPPYFGRFGRLKALIGERFYTCFAGTGLKLDISVDPQQALMGDAWLRFLGNCRFTLGCESGSSLLDPTGAFNRACRVHLARNPKASFEEVEAACFPGQDMRRIYSAISPRIFEAALAGTCQVLVPASYMGVLKPSEHYIAWDPGAGDPDTLHEELTDWPRAKARVEACGAALLSSERLNYRGFVADLLNRIEAKLDALGRLSQRRWDGIKPANSPEAIHRLVEKAVYRAIVEGGSVIELTDPSVPSGARSEDPIADGPPGAPTICLLALSVIADDPRVRRQGDLFARAGWRVTAVGLSGGRSHPPDWPIVSKGALPMAVVVRHPGEDRAEAPTLASARATSEPTAVADPGAGSLAVAHRRFVLWRKRIAMRLVAVPRLRRLVRLAWRCFRIVVLLPIWTFYGLQLRTTKALVLARRIGCTLAVAMAKGLCLRQPLRALLAGNSLQGDTRWRAVAYRLGMLRSPEAVEAIFWNDLAISYDLRGMYQAARDLHADIWLANDWTALPLAARLAREKGGVYVYDTHEFATEEYAEKPQWRRWKRPIVQALERLFIVDAQVVSTVSDGIARRLDRLYSLPHPTLVVRNTPYYEPCSFRPTGSRIRVLYHGIIVPGRGLEVAIDSVAEWRGEFQLTIRGPDNPEFTPALRAQIAERGLGDRVVLAPPVAMTALVHEATAFDIGFFALPGHSRHNEFALPNKIFEYMMAGLCLCTTELPEIAALIDRYGLGATVPTLEAAAIAAAINSLDRERIDVCKRNALNAARELCWEQESERLLAAYRPLLPQPALALAS
jgi:glycosyltransferase involved in cell wall biosynthesis